MSAVDASFEFLTAPENLVLFTSELDEIGWATLADWISTDLTVGKLMHQYLVAKSTETSGEHECSKEAPAVKKISDGGNHENYVKYVPTSAELEKAEEVASSRYCSVQSAVCDSKAYTTWQCVERGVNEVEVDRRSTLFCSVEIFVVIC